VARRPCHLLSAKSKAKYASTIAIIVIITCKVTIFIWQQQIFHFSLFTFHLFFITFAGGNYSPTTKNNGKTEKIPPSGE
jgi:hypothetical protein